MQSKDRSQPRQDKVGFYIRLDGEPSLATVRRLRILVAKEAERDEPSLPHNYRTVSLHYHMDLEDARKLRETLKASPD